MVAVQTDIKNLETDLKKVNLPGLISPTKGFHRLAWHQAESDSIEYVKSECERIGLHTYYDQVGNFHSVLEGKSGKRILIGSHLDTVPNGGAYDGAIGSCIPLNMLRGLVATPGERQVGVEYVIIKGEESSFGVSLKGSQMLFGQFPVRHLDSTDRSLILSDNFADVNGKEIRPSLREAMLHQGFNPDSLNQAIITESDKSKYLGFLEIHCQQRAQLRDEGYPLGIVTSIKGSTRPVVKFSGRSGHTSEERPSNKSEDTSDAAAALKYKISETVKYLKQSNDLFKDVTLVSRVLQSQGSNTTYSEYTTVTFDIRSANDNAREAIYEIIEAETKQLSDKYAVLSKIIAKPNIPGVLSLDKQLIQTLTSCAQKLEIPTLQTPSLAAHDALMFALNGIPTAMIFVRDQKGESHVFDEHVDIEDIYAAEQLATQFYWQIENQHASRSQ